MDTTDHAFELTTFEFGDCAGCYFRDVAVINDTLAYAVGEVYLRRDGGALDYVPYNLARWDGKHWTLLRVSYPCRGVVITPPLEGVVALSDRDIWLSSGVPVHGDGSRWTEHHLFDMGVLTAADGCVNRIWVGDGELYVAGGHGTIVRYDGSTWTHLVSGTTTAITDVWGPVQTATGEQAVLCTVTNSYSVGDRRIVVLGRTGVQSEIPWHSTTNIESIWFDGDNTMFAAGDGVYIMRSNGPWVRQDVLPNFYATCIRGEAWNDAFVIMHGGYVAHYNGASWKTWNDNASRVLYRCAYRNTVCMAVGTTGQQHAVITMLKRTSHSVQSPMARLK